MSIITRFLNWLFGRSEKKSKPSIPVSYSKIEKKPITVPDKGTVRLHNHPSHVTSPYDGGSYYDPTPAIIASSMVDSGSYSSTDCGSSSCGDAGCSCGGDGGCM